MHTAAHKLSEDESTAQIEVNIVMRGEEHSHIVVIGVVGDGVASVGVGVVECAIVVVARTIVTVIVAVGTGNGVADDKGVAVEHQVGTTTCLGAYVTGDIVTAVDIAVDTAGEIDAAGVLDVTHAAAAEDIVADDFGVGQCGNDGADLVGEGIFAVGFSPTAIDEGAVGRVDVVSLHEESVVEGLGEELVCACTRA